MTPKPTAPPTRPPSAPSAAPAPAPHTAFDDLQALASAMVIVALGLHLLADARLFLGGVPGLAFLLTHATALPLGLALFVVNLPFCALAWRVLGTRFTLRSLLAMALLSATVEAVRAALVVQHVHPALAAVAGGLLVGTGLLILLRHRASLGGVGVVAIALQRRFGWNVGHVQLAADALILAAALPLADGPRMLWSLLAAAALNGVLMWNHRPGRYPAGAM